MSVSTAIFLALCMTMAPGGACRAEIADAAPFRVATPTVGIASQYDPGVMAGVVSRQQRLGRLPADVRRFDGFIAVRRCSDVGKFYLLRPLGTERWELFAAVDCSGSVETTAWMIENNIICEIDYASAMRFRTVNRGIKVEMVGVP